MKWINHKRSSMAVAALLILIFHLWITTNTSSEIESFIKLTGYIGVDMFFLLSAHSFGKRMVEDPKQFILSRLKALYPKYVIFALIYTFYKGYPLLRFIKMITFIELFTKGGGSFLWFIPAILIFYMVIPYYQRLDKKDSKIALCIAIVIYFILAFACTKFYRPLLIMINRIPILLVGYYLERIPVKFPIAAGSILLIVGIVLVYRFGYKIRLNSPIYDLFYVIAIPYALGLSILTSRIKGIKIIDLIGSITLELYALQMIFGYTIANKLYVMVHQRMISNLLTVLIMIIISYGFAKGYQFITKKLAR